MGLSKERTRFSLEPMPSQFLLWSITFSKMPRRTRQKEIILPGTMKLFQMRRKSQSTLEKLRNLFRVLNRATKRQQGISSQRGDLRRRNTSRDKDRETTMTRLGQLYLLLVAKMMKRLLKITNRNKQNLRKQRKKSLSQRKREQRSKLQMVESKAQKLFQQRRELLNFWKEALASEIN